ncbi:Holliday junction resolvase RusA-like endonuclease [Agrobacterium vitis]|nr:Holliday junction resolvase RusA-like endonuclease [Agrobacterium vitis]MBE1439685.1 Holliday junction resolvase RusA-like endonuclease [Agrobacterium vitis]
MTAYVLQFMSYLEFYATHLPGWRRNKLIKFIFAISLFWAGLTGFDTYEAHAETNYTIYYNSVGGRDKTLGFRLLQLAVEKSGKPYQIKPSPTGYNTNPAMVNAIAEGGKIDIGWVVAAKAVSSKLLAIPFPLDRGLIGYRIFLIDGARQNEFDRIQNLDDLRKYIGLLGNGWSDVDVMRKNGFTIRTAPQKNLYRMTVGRRGDFFSRAMSEAFNEYAAQVQSVPELAIEQSLVMHYPSAIIFYVSKSRPELRDDILAGLKAAWDDGSYEKTFLADSDVQLAFQKGNLKNRRIIEIMNPNIPPDIETIDKKYWINPRD